MDAWNICAEKDGQRRLNVCGLTNWGLEVRVEAVEPGKGLVADVALVARAIPGALSRLIRGGAVPSDQVLADETVGILRTHELV